VHPAPGVGTDFADTGQRVGVAAQGGHLSRDPKCGRVDHDASTP
jgi:hypothetical protein